MTESELITIINKLRAYTSEQEWFEFKGSFYEPQLLGEYLSALANSACVHDKEKGFLIFGIDDTTHDFIGTTFDPDTAKGKGSQPLHIWLTSNLHPNCGFVIHTLTHQGKRVVLFEINAAVNQPVAFCQVEYIRIGESKTELRKHPDKAARIWNKNVLKEDWSARICGSATLNDLDPAAIEKARKEFSIKNPDQASAIAEWDAETLLNKAKVLRQGQITNAAIILLGKPESVSLLTPAVAQISWFLKDESGNDKDYAHFSPPFLLNVDAVFAKIRNLTVRHLPAGTLFPLETTQYDPWVVREALHNSIAHQDYSLQGRITVVETPTRLLLTNLGSFLPGSVEAVIKQDSPPERYRNKFLADAMVNLKMIDTQGGGIKKMFGIQMKRFFPLPDYNLDNQGKVSVSIQGEIIDERYTRLLMERTDLDLWTVILLDKVQKKVLIDKDQYKCLKKLSVVEGRFPNLFIAGNIAKAIGESAQHIKNRPLDIDYYYKLILELISEHQPVTREDIDQLLLNKLSEVLTEEQKKSRIHNYLTTLSKAGKIKRIGSKRFSKWVLGDHTTTIKNNKKQ